MDESGMSSLHVHAPPIVSAVDFGHSRVVHLLVSHGAECGVSVLEFAAGRGRASGVTQVFNAAQRKAKNIRDAMLSSVQTGAPLIYAVWAGQTDTVRELVRLGACLENTHFSCDEVAGNRCGGPPMCFAAAAGDAAMIACLAELGADVNGEHPTRECPAIEIAMGRKTGYQAALKLVEYNALVQYVVPRACPAASLSVHSHTYLA
jgi:hypothetical protein